LRRLIASISARSSIEIDDPGSADASSVVISPPGVVIPLGHLRGS
jgi:hypothetical protein